MTVTAGPRDGRTGEPSVPSEPSETVQVVTNRSGTALLADMLRQADWSQRLEACTEDQLRSMARSAETVDARLAEGRPVYGLTRGFGPLVLFAAESESEQGHSLVSHLGTGQGRYLSPQVCRLVVWLRLTSMRRGFSPVTVGTWQALADLWNAGFTPAIPRDGTVSASGDLQPLAHAALAARGEGEAWVRDGVGQWVTVPAARALTDLGAQPLAWRVRDALAFVNGTGVSLAVTISNHRSLLRLVRVLAAASGRLARVLGANPEHFHPGVARVRGQLGQATVADWIREELGSQASHDPRRPLQEPYSVRCAAQVLGAVLDQLDFTADVLAREAGGCTDNPLTVDGEVLHAGNFHAMPVGLASDQLGLGLHTAVYLAERQIGLVVNPATNGDLPMMLTPRAGRGCGLAGVQISATSFVSRIRQLVYPASLTTLPTNGWNQDHVPMALNGANGVEDALEQAWWVVGSLGVALAQFEAMEQTSAEGVWAQLAEISPPLDEDRPMAHEVRQARDLLEAHGEHLLTTDAGGRR